MVEWLTHCSKNLFVWSLELKLLMNFRLYETIKKWLLNFTTTRERVTEASSNLAFEIKLVGFDSIHVEAHEWPGITVFKQEVLLVMELMRERPGRNLILNDEQKRISKLSKV